jgi:hypothetical protein
MYDGYEFWLWFFQSAGIFQDRFVCIRRLYILAYTQNDLTFCMSAEIFVCIIAGVICTNFGQYHFYGGLKLLCVLYNTEALN